MAIYDMESNSIVPITDLGGEPSFGFAWSPKEDVFVVTQSRKMVLFKRSASGTAYVGTIISSPLDFLYSNCSWSPKGDWIAMECFDYKRSVYRLGLYHTTTHEFILSETDIRHNTIFWKDDSTIYAIQDGDIVEFATNLEINRNLGFCSVDQGYFYGMCDGRPVIAHEGKICLNGQVLTEVDGFRPLIVNKKFVFVSISADQLVVFDGSGDSICEANPGMDIRFGSISDTPNVIYGYSGTKILRIFVKDGSLDIQFLCDTTDDNLYAHVHDRQN